MKSLNPKRVNQLAKMGGKLEGDQPVNFVTATEIRLLAEAWLLLDDIDRRIAAVIDPHDSRFAAAGEPPTGRWQELGRALVDVAEAGIFGPDYITCVEGCTCVVCDARKLLRAPT